MNTFAETLDPNSWTEILQGNGFLAFDVGTAADAYVYFTNKPDAPASDDAGNVIQTFNAGWDFSASGMDGLTQLIWVKGSGVIRGVRG